MKKLNFFLSLSVSIFFLLAFSTTTANAQCAVVGTDADGNSVTIAISCDFPVKLETGNAAADEATYEAEKTAWKAAHADDYAAILSLNNFSYYEIHQADLDAMSPEKQAVILSQPAQYHIL